MEFFSTACYIFLRTKIWLQRRHLQHIKKAKSSQVKPFLANLFEQNVGQNIKEILYSTKNRGLNMVFF